MLDRLTTSEALLAELRARPPARAKLQDFRHLCNYFSERQWCLLLSDVGCPHKVRLVCEHAVSLGLRNPSETTTAAITAFLLVVVEGGSKAKASTPMQKRDFFLFVKNSLKIKASAGLEQVGDLPLEPVGFQRLYPLTHRAAFGNEPPVGCKVSLVDVASVTAGVSMRNRVSGSSGSAAVSSSTPDLGTMQQLMGIMQLMGGMCQQQPQAGRGLQSMGSFEGQVPGLQILRGRQRPCLQNALSAADRFAHPLLQNIAEGNGFASSSGGFASMTDVGFQAAPAAFGFQADPAASIVAQTASADSGTALAATVAQEPAPIAGPAQAAGPAPTTGPAPAAEAEQAMLRPPETVSKGVTCRE